MKIRLSFVLICLLSFGFKAHAQTTNYQAYSLFVYGVTKYMSWPTSGKTEFAIIVYGKSRVIDEMRKAFVGKSINGLPIKITQIEELTGIEDPHVLYLSDGKSAQLEEIRKKTSGMPVLIIAEREGLHKKGAGMSFIVVGDKLRIDVNNTELQTRQIKTSGQIQPLINETI